VALSVAETVTLTTAAPLGSVTFPRSEPVFCARTALDVNTNPNIKKNISSLENPLFIPYLQKLALKRPFEGEQMMRRPFGKCGENI
jgi:hypothetical protein